MYRVIINDVYFEVLNATVEIYSNSVEIIFFVNEIIKFINHKYKNDIEL